MKPLVEKKAQGKRLYVLCSYHFARNCDYGWLCVLLSVMKIFSLEGEKRKRFDVKRIVDMRFANKESPHCGVYYMYYCIGIPTRVSRTRKYKLHCLFIIALAFQFHRTYPPTTPTYMVTETEPVVESTNQLGSALPITVTFSNSGPSTLPGANLVILLPLRNAADTGDYYYLYPLSVNVSRCREAVWLIN